MMANPTPVRADFCLFFGTFNPIHNGHLLMAEAALNHFAFKRILFIPAGSPPHRQQDLDMAPAIDRLEMVRLAIGHNPAFSLSDIELKQEGPTYTYETLKKLFPQGIEGLEIPLIIGSDALDQLGSWYKAEQLVRVGYFLQAPRATTPFVQEVLMGDKPSSLNTQLIPMPLIGIASTEIRHRVRLGKSIRYWVPDPVRRYISDNRLYQAQ
jgi:nicotinate-nucleotide adenylyltransferase